MKVRATADPSLIVGVPVSFHTVPLALRVHNETCVAVDAVSTITCFTGAFATEEKQSPRAIDAAGSSCFTSETIVEATGNRPAFTSVSPATAALYAVWSAAWASLSFADSSTGVWEATTNLLVNGGFETNTTGWSGYNSATVTQTAAGAMFGSSGALVSWPALAADRGISSFPINGTEVGGNTYALSVWVKSATGSPEAGQIRCIATDVSGGNIVSGCGAPSTFSFTATTSWQRISGTFTVPAGTDKVEIRPAERPQANAAAGSVYIDGVQLEQKPKATPYVETSGSSASRTAARVQAPAAALTSTQFWWAARVRVGAIMLTNQVIASWRATNGTYYQMYLDNTGVPVVQDHDLSSYSTVSQGSAPAVGSAHTIIGYFTSSTVAISVDGSSFNTVANTHPPTFALLPALFDLGSFNGGNQCDCSVVWFAAGTGTLTDQDATTIAGFADNDPKHSNFPTPAQASII